MTSVFGQYSHWASEDITISVCEWVIVEEGCYIRESLFNVIIVKFHLSKIVISVPSHLYLLYVRLQRCFSSNRYETCRKPPLNVSMIYQRLKSSVRCVISSVNVRMLLEILFSQKGGTVTLEVLMLIEASCKTLSSAQRWALQERKSWSCKTSTSTSDKTSTSRHLPKHFFLKKSYSCNYTYTAKF